MALRIRALLVACGLVVLCVLGVVVYVATHSNPAPPVVPPPPVAADLSAETADPEPPAPPDRPQTRRRRQSAAPAQSPDAEAAAEPDLSPDEAARAEAEAQARKEAEEAVARIRRQVIRDLELTSDQIAATEVSLAGMENLTRSMVDLAVEASTTRLLLARQAKENGWTSVQAKQVREQASREFFVAHQGRILQYVDSTMQTMEEFRPHLTAEQIPRLDEKLGDWQRLRDQFLQGTLNIF